MKSQSDAILKVVGKLARRDEKQDKIPWPPMCAGFLHQPKRPIKKQQ